MIEVLTPGLQIKPVSETGLEHPTLSLCSLTSPEALNLHIFLM
jgi:hypothetical protein